LDSTGYSTGTLEIVVAIEVGIVVLRALARAAGRTAPDIIAQLLKEARWQPK